MNELLKVSPQHANGNITYSRILIEKFKSGPPDVKSVEKIMSHYELAFQSSKEVSSRLIFQIIKSIIFVQIEPVILEMLKFIREYGQPEQKVAVFVDFYRNAIYFLSHIF